jgi:hypothetical protein
LKFNPLGGAGRWVISEFVDFTLKLSFSFTWLSSIGAGGL